MSPVRILGVMCVLAAAVLYNSCCFAEEAGVKQDRAKVHKDDLVDKEHFPNGEHTEEYDHEAFLGDQKEEFDELSPEDAKTRLKVLAKKVDTDKDGFVSEDELTTWVRTVFKQRLFEGVDEDLKEKDADGDGKVTWHEYSKSLYGTEETEEEDEETKEMFKKDQRRWNAADKDKDDKLSLEEYGNFMHPESSEDLADLHVIETMEDIDNDKDNLISMDEFLGDYKDPDDATSEDPEWVGEERKRFKEEYDKNNDGKLDKDEMRLWILPETDTAMAQEEARHLVSSSDENDDGKLSLEEILDHQGIFVGSDATDYGRALPKHDEF